MSIFSTAILSEACLGKWDETRADWRKEAALEADVSEFQEPWSLKKKKVIFMFFSALKLILENSVYEFKRATAS